jgi:hypothetical protein
MPAEYEPTDAQRSLVENAAAFGLTGAGFVQYFDSRLAYYGPPRLREFLRCCLLQSASTYPALEQSSEPRWRSAQPGPHNLIDLNGPLSFTGFQAAVRLLGHLVFTTPR